MFWEKLKQKGSAEVSTGQQNVSVEVSCKAMQENGEREGSAEKIEKNREGLHYDAQTANEKGFYFRINGQNCKIMNYKGADAHVQIPDTINGKSVKEIRTRAFAGKQIKSVVFPKDLLRIGEEAFQGCALEKIELPARMESIAQNAFGGCEKLTEVTLHPQGKKNFEVDWKAFADTPYIKSEAFVILGHMLLRINLTKDVGELCIPRNVKYIKREAAQYEKSRWRVDWVSRIFIPASVQRIEDKAFDFLANISCVQVESFKKFHYVHLGRDVFGSMAAYSPFKMCLIREKLGQNSIYLVGWKEFRELEIGGFDWGCRIGKCRIFIPDSKHWEFLECLQIKFSSTNDFCICLESKDYFELMLQVRSFHDKMEMAKFFIYRSNDSKLSKRLKEFLRKHEGRARKFAVRKNDNELLQLYHKYDFWWDIEKYEETKDA
ncbi:MAG: leucine-rich repeat domain-containing protein [Lachnospiraceae bacterium]|nr:leucine-rich repeat domain-containing protein [Lachnospiraceae bacterium]